MILTVKASGAGMNLPDEVAALLAQTISGDVQALEGALQKRVAYCLAQKESFSLEAARIAILSTPQVNGQTTSMVDSSPQ